jgi:hypothetical protein
MSPHRESRIADHTQKQAGATIPPMACSFSLPQTFIPVNGGSHALTEDTPTIELGLVVRMTVAACSHFLPPTLPPFLVPSKRRHMRRADSCRDRPADCIQLFKRGGTCVKEAFLAKRTLGESKSSYERAGSGRIPCPVLSALFVPQRLDRVQPCRAYGREHTEENSDGRRKPEPKRERRQRQ